VTQDEQAQVGTRVRVRQDPDQPIGTVIASPEGHPSEPVETISGVRRLYWIAFDEPQFDVEGNGPYPSSQVLDKYLEILAD
jgi:hypothetical protein